MKEDGETEEDCIDDSEGESAERSQLVSKRETMCGCGGIQSG